MEAARLLCFIIRCLQMSYLCLYLHFTRSCGQTPLDIRSDHPDLHAGLLPAAHAGHQHPLPAYWLAAAPGEGFEQDGQQLQLWPRKSLHVPQAEAEQTQRASYQNAV